MTRAEWLSTASSFCSTYDGDLQPPSSKGAKTYKSLVDKILSGQHHPPEHTMAKKLVATIREHMTNVRLTHQVTSGTGKAQVKKTFYKNYTDKFGDAQLEVK